MPALSNLVSSIGANMLNSGLITLSLSVFIAARDSATSSDIWDPPATTELERRELGPALPGTLLPSPELRRACLNVELMVGRCRVGDGLVSFSEALEAAWTLYVLLPELMFSWLRRSGNRFSGSLGLEERDFRLARSGSSSSGSDAMKDTFWGAMSSSSGAGIEVCRRRSGSDGAGGATAGTDGVGVAGPPIESRDTCREYEDGFMIGSRLFSDSDALRRVDEGVRDNGIWGCCWGLGVLGPAEPGPLS